MAKSPSWVYKKAFGEYPTNDISIVESNYRFGGDYIEVILKFKTNDLSKLLASHAELKPITQEKFEKQIYSPQLPSWFKPLEKLPSKFYMASPYGGEYGSSDALLSYNSESGLVFFRYSAVD